VSARFYATWALAVLLALVLPVAVPFVLWGAESGADRWSGPEADVFGHVARNKTEGARHLPASVSVSAGPLLDEPVGCDGPSAMHSLSREYTADIAMRGPYGLPYATYVVRCNIDGDGGFYHVTEAHPATAVAGVAALFGGAFAVSIPFALLWLRSARREELLSAT